MSLFLGAADFEDENFFNRPIGVEHVNFLIKLCGIVQENPIHSLWQCSSSLFVLLFQRLLNFPIPELELEPNTHDKKLKNITKVLAELSLIGDADLSYISATEIVNCNEEHISMLIRVFVHLALHLMRAQHEAELAHQRSSAFRLNGSSGAPLSAPPAAMGDMLTEGVEQQQNFEGIQETREAAHVPSERKPSSKRHSHHHGPSTATNDSQQPHASGSPADEVDAPSRRSYTAAEVQRLAEKALAAIDDGRQHQSNSAAAVRTESQASDGSDSEAFTNELVHEWNSSVVPPPARCRGALVDPLSLVEVRQRIESLERLVADRLSKGRRPPRPTAHDSRHNVIERAAELTQRRLSAVILNNELRDEKILKLRAQRVQEAFQQTLRRQVVANRSAAEATLIADFRAAAAAEQKWRRDEIRRVKDEDDALRRAVACVVESERNRLKLNSDLLSDETARIAKKHFAAVREAKRTLREKQSVAAQAAKDTVARYADHASSWRNSIPIFCR